MAHLSRRGFMQSTGLLAGAVALGACDTAPEGGSASSELEWWDHYVPLEDLHQRMFAKFEKQSDGMPVKYVVRGGGKQGQALQLAHSSKQMPDVFTLAGVEVPPAKLHEQGWFAPLAWSDAIKKKLPENAMLEGINVFGGKAYSFPLFTFRQHVTVPWFHKKLFAKADLDPEDPPTTWDEFRKAARAITKTGGGQVSGWLAPLKSVGRIGVYADELAQTAGFEGSEGIDFRTGAYAYHSDPYVNAIDFLLAMKKDGVLFPSSASLDTITAIGRWAAGSAGFLFDGSWLAGIAKDQYPQIVEDIGVGPIPVAEPGSQPTIYEPPKGGQLWLAAGSELVEEASELLTMFTEPGYMTRLAANMDQPPADLSAVERADVHPAYGQVIENFAQQVFLAPSPPVKNAATADVTAGMKDIQPDIGAIAAGAIAGEISDVPKALKKLSDTSEAERERAIAKVRKKGGEVSVDAWAFPNWKPAVDYDQEDYPA